jgi:hypothetical protein
MTVGVRSTALRNVRAADGTIHVQLPPLNGSATVGATKSRLAMLVTRQLRNCLDGPSVRVSSLVVVARCQGVRSFRLTTPTTAYGSVGSPTRRSALENVLWPPRACAFGYCCAVSTNQSAGFIQACQMYFTPSSWAERSAIVRAARLLFARIERMLEV